MAAPDITICSVFHDAFTRSCLVMNVEATARFNPGQIIPWVVTDNSPRDLPAIPLPDRVTLVAGNPPDPSIPEIVRGSYHHGTAINQSIEPVTTRWALILDVDFFVIQTHWARHITSYAEDSGLSFFGTPWHPRWFNKFRGFPSVHCLLIDLEKVALDELDFRPDLLDQLVPEERDPPTTETPVHRSRASTITRNLTALLLLRDRRVIGSSHDTGYRLYQRFGRDSQFTTECLQPVYKPSEQFEGPRHARGAFNRLLERVLPERLCYFPKEAGSFSVSGFRELGAYDAISHGWEEFLWRGAPFGLHFRGYQNRADDERALIDLKRALASFDHTGETRR